MKQKLVLVLIFSFVLACSKGKQKSSDEVVDSLPTQEKTTVSRIGITLNSTAKKGVQHWDKYQIVRDKMEGYQSVTKNKALQNAEELALLIEDASDTIDIEILDRPDVKIRFNVLHNYAYRLYDMSTISSISDEDVNEEITGLLNAFSALNDKINVVYTITEYKKEFSKVSFDTAFFQSPFPTENRIQDKPTPFKITTARKAKLKKPQKKKAATNSKFIKSGNLNK